MKSGLLKLVASVLSSVFLAGTMSFVEAATVNQRQRNQQQRIDQGIRRGELTRHEVKRLEREQTHIRHDEARAKSDGSKGTGEDSEGTEQSQCRNLQTEA
jgi:hypothetical protein